MADPLSHRTLLLSRAADFAEVAVRNIRREFPNLVMSVMRHPGDFPHRPKDRYPAFHGSFDWHSCVEMHWTLVRLLRKVPDALPEARIRAALEESLTAKSLAGEAAKLHDGGRFPPYAWGWALSLAEELADWDDPDARRWSANFAPLADAIEAAMCRWLPKRVYPNRSGLHQNTAFSLSRALPYARRRAADDAPALLDAIANAAGRWYAADRDYPGAWEPNDSDFLSGALVEAELLTALWPEAQSIPWLDAFLPELARREPAALFTPAIVGDDSDGWIAHLRGLNLSRAWCWRTLAERIPAQDPRVPVMLAAASAHAEPELDHVDGSDYMVEHWLVCYAALYLT